MKGDQSRPRRYRWVVQGGLCVLQIKVYIPAGVPAGVAEVIVTAGTAYSPGGVIVSTIDTR